MRSKRLAASSSREPTSLGPGLAPGTPSAAEGGRHTPSWLLLLPSDLLSLALSLLEAKDLAALSSTCSTLAEAGSECWLWRAEWERAYGPATALHAAAAAAAGSWKALYAARHAALKAADPWQQPSSWEVQASIDLLAGPPPGAAMPGASSASGSAGGAGEREAGELAPDPAAAAAAPPAPAPAPSANPFAAAPAPAAAPAAAAGEEGGEIVPAEDAAEEGEEAELCVCFLVDGSGSVTEEDFQVMTGFMATAVARLAARFPASPGGDGCASGAGGAGGAGGGPAGASRARVAVVQFSNDVRVELGPTPASPANFETLVGGLQRMNGGTNIALAVQKAGQLLKGLRVKRRALALLTDGRIDSHQAREARDMAARLADEQGGVSLHAYGVGRGVDRQELLRIISATDAPTAEDRYLGLCVLDEAPW